MLGSVAEHESNDNQATPTLHPDVLLDANKVGWEMRRGRRRFRGLCLLRDSVDRSWVKGNGCELIGCEWKDEGKEGISVVVGLCWWRLGEGRWMRADRVRVKG